MSAAISIKRQTRPLLWTATLLHIVAFLFITLGIDRLREVLHEQSLEQWLRLLSGSLPLIAITSVVCIFVLGVVPPRFRDQIAHFRWNHPLPSAAAFSRHGPQDPRVDMAFLEASYGPLPDEPSQQHRCFYRIYRTVARDPVVLEANRLYIAARDVTTLSAIASTTLPVLAFSVGVDTATVLRYVAALFGLYALTVTATQQYGVRLVQHALAAAAAPEGADATRTEEAS